METETTAVFSDLLTTGHHRNLRTQRIALEVQEFFRENPKNLHIIPDVYDIGIVYALITGPEKTPYQGGFFYLVVKLPEDYPLQPPKVQLMTTGGGTTALHPCFDRTGLIALNILKRDWTPGLSLLAVLLSIQSLLGPNPYFIPGQDYFLTDKTKVLADQFNDWAFHETIRVAVIGMLDPNSGDASTMPLELKDVMVSFFRSNYHIYEDIVILEMKFNDFAQLNTGFCYRYMLENLLKLKKHYSIPDTTDQSLCEIWSQTRAQLSHPVQQRVEPLVVSYHSKVEKIISNVEKTDLKPEIDGSTDESEPDQYEEDIADQVKSLTEGIDDCGLDTPPRYIVRHLEDLVMESDTDHEFPSSECETTASGNSSTDDWVQLDYDSEAQHDHKD